MVHKRMGITEQVGSGTKKDYSPTPVVTYRVDSDRVSNADDMWSLWKINPVMQGRITQLNDLVFGKGIQYAYQDQNIQAIIDRLWRVNRLQSKLDQIGTNSQLYGDVFVAMYPQKSGDLLLAFYEPAQVEIDFNPANPTEALSYIVSWHDEEKNKDNTIEFQPVETFLNEIEFSNPMTNGVVNKAKNMTKAPKYKGKGLMAHVYFNATTSQMFGTSDFYQTSDILQDYMAFVGDRLTIHQLYGSPVYDITIDTDDPQKIQDRIADLSGFTLGSNPVHNKSEEWKLLNASQGNGNGSISSDSDNEMLKSIISCGLCFPTGLLFQDSGESEVDTSALETYAQKRQQAFKSLLEDIHKVAVAIAGGDPSLIDEGQIVFPEINTSSAKSKAETGALLVNTGVVSRSTVSTSLGYSWDKEKEQMVSESEELQDVINPQLAYTMTQGQLHGGEGQTSKTGKSNTERDKKQRKSATNIDKESRPMSQRKDDSTTAT